jgi:hypothetical protein
LALSTGFKIYHGATHQNWVKHTKRPQN